MSLSPNALSQNSAAHVSQIHIPLAVIGGGIVGCTLALLLSKTLNVSVILYDQEHWSDLVSEDFSQAWRVSAVSEAVRLLWQQLEVWQAAEKTGICPIDNMTVLDENSLSELVFSAEQSERSSLGYLIKNAPVLAVLREKVLLDSNIQVCDAHTLIDAVPGQVFTRLIFNKPDQSRLQATTELVLDAVGGQGVLAQACQNTIPLKSLGHTSIVCQLEVEGSHQNLAQQIYLSTGPLAFLPLTFAVTQKPEKHLVSIVWSLPTVEAERLLLLDEQSFLAQLQPWLPAIYSGVSRCSDRAGFALRSGVARRFISSGIAWVGDSCHHIHPMAGQGLTLGLMDVASLVDALAHAAERGVALNHWRVLRRYERSRKLHVNGAVKLTNALHHLNESHHWGLQLGKALGVKLLNQSKLLKRVLVDQANADTQYLPARFRSLESELPY